MKSGKIWLLSFMLLISPTSHTDEIDTHAAINIVQSIIGQCESEGMLSCESRLHGIGTLFDYIRMYRQVIALDNELRKFVAHKYPNAPKLPFEAIKASRHMAINVNLTTEQFMERVISAQQVVDGYDVIIDQENGPILELRRKNQQWVMIFPSESSRHFDQLKTLTAAGKLKRSIMIYRIMEADMLDISKQELEKRLNLDLSPLLLGIFGKKRVPELEKWQNKEMNEVIDFYSQFSNPQQMNNYIKQNSKRLNEEDSSVNAANPLLAH
ncbi:MAG: hypothetical protein ACRBB4_10525 [Neptuniibacter sp.]